MGSADVKAEPDSSNESDSYSSGPNSDFSSENGSSDESDLDKFEEAFTEFRKLSQGLDDIEYERGEAGIKSDDVPGLVSLLMVDSSHYRHLLMCPKHGRLRVSRSHWVASANNWSVWLRVIAWRLLLWMSILTSMLHQSSSLPKIWSFFLLSPVWKNFVASSPGAGPSHKGALWPFFLPSRTSGEALSVI